MGLIMDTLEDNAERYGQFLYSISGVSEPGIHLRRDSLSSITYSEKLISATISATLQSTDRHHGIVGQKCCHYQCDS